MNEMLMWLLLAGMLAVGGVLRVGLFLGRFSLAAFLTGIGCALGLGLDYQLNVFLALSAALLLFAVLRKDRKEVSSLRRN